jgi:hypothetical protein
MKSPVRGTKLQNHSKMYERQKDNRLTIEEICEYLTNNRINCVKYNYSLDEEVQNFSTFEG